MKTYVEMNSTRFEEIESAVEEAERDSLESAEIVVRNGEDEVIDVIEVDSESDYKFHAYAVFHDKYDDGEEWEWYHNVEVCYNSEEEARNAIRNAEKGTYKISKVIQTLHEYIESEDLETVVVE